MTEPSLDEAEWIPWLRLRLTFGMGRVRTHRLLQLYGSPGAILQQTEEDLVQRGGIPPDVARNIRSPARIDEARAELARMNKLGVSLSHPGRDDYPELLDETSHPPIIVGRLGPLGNPGRRAVAIVGSRKAGRRACRIARDFARDLAEAGVTIVSGLARGIDREAHEGALMASEGRTIAVLGNGLARVYPSEHAGLAARIRERGALLSELPADAPPSAHHFPVRNRIIAGTSLGVVVIGAGFPSGAITTVDAAEQCGDQREVFAVPGTLDDEYARGCNLLLKEGRAHLVEGARDVLLALGLVAPQPNVNERPPVRPRAKRTPLSGVPGEIEAYLESVGRHCSFDEIVFENKIDARAAMSALGFLALRQRVREEPGVGYVLVDA